MGRSRKPDTMLAPHLSDAEFVEHLCKRFTKRELAEYIGRREVAWRKSARTRMKPIQERLGDNIIIRGFTPHDCYIWQGATNGRGYGTISHNGRRKYVHRVTYELEHGPIPNGLMIDHLCRETLCCNPEHLEAVTNRENTLRGKVSALRHLRKSA
jgi:hypothetical protein